MSQIPLLSEHPRPVQFVLVFVLPVLFGAIAGVLLGISEPVYVVLSLLVVLGGIGAGYDHARARSGAARGALGGTLFGASILIAHEIHGEPAKAHLPEPAIVLVVVTALLGIALGALGGWLRDRSLRKQEAEGPPPDAEAAPKPTASAAAPAAPPSPPAPAQATAPSPTQDAAPAPPQAAASPPPPTTKPAARGGVVSLTSGNFEDYRGLGMSVTQAKRVIAYRERDGGYSSVDDLDHVPGFSREFLAQLKQKLQV